MAECLQLKIDSFTPGVTQFNRWFQRLEGAFTISAIKDEARVPYFLHYLGSKAFDILSDNYEAGKDLYKENYAALTKKAKDLFEPVVLEIAENFKFNHRKQLAGEDIQTYVTALNNLSANCNFGAYRDKALRNQFVFGIENSRIQSRLLETKDLDLKKAVNIAMAMELADKERSNLGVQENQVNYIQASRKPVNKYSNSRNQPYRKNVNKSQNNANRKNFNTSQNNNMSCYRCNGNHLASKCNQSNLFCKWCKKTGHLVEACFKKKRMNVNVMENENEREVESEEDIQNFDLFHLQTTDSIWKEKFMKNLTVNNKPVNFEVDTGAAVSIMFVEEARRLFDSEIFSTSLKLVTYCKNKIDIAGYMYVNVLYNNKNFVFKLYLSKIARNPIVGREWICTLVNNSSINFFFSEISNLKVHSINYVNNVDSNFKLNTELSANLEIKKIITKISKNY